MMKKMMSVLVGSFVMLFSVGAQATVTEFLSFSYPYEQIQTGEICFANSTMIAELGIAPASAMTGSLKSVFLYKQNELPAAFVNINLLATTPAMVPTYVMDRWVGSVLEYTMILDVTALKNANGTTVAGRTRTLRLAKLALLAMARNLKGQSNGQFRLWLRFTGLPSQTGLPGTALSATTTYAYSASSPVLAAFERELVNRLSNCP